MQIPLKPEEELAVDLQVIFSGVYERASFDMRIDYPQPVPPPAPDTLSAIIK